MNTIYLDMDGVVADFRQRFYNTVSDPKTGKLLYPDQYRSLYGIDAFWEEINGQGIKFWEGIPFTPNGKKLWREVKTLAKVHGYKLEMLTAPSLEEGSRIGKERWVAKNLLPNPKVNFKFSKRKQELAKPGDILIDDRLDNIQRWESAGGVGIHHPENSSDITGVLRELELAVNPG